MHVLFVNHTSLMSGAEQSLVSLVRGLQSLREERKLSLLAALPCSGSLSEALEREHVVLGWAPSLRRLKRVRSPLALLRYGASLFAGSYQVSQLASQQSVNLVHANSATALLYTAIAGRLSHRKVVWHDRDLRDLGKLFRCLFALSDGIIAISHTVAKFLVAKGCPPGKVGVIYNPVDATLFLQPDDGQKVRQEWGIPEDAVLFGMVSQLVPWKNHEAFILAAAKVAKQVKAARFVLVGDDLFGDHPDYKRRLHDLAFELGLADQHETQARSSFSPSPFERRECRMGKLENQKPKFVFAGYRADMPAVMAALDVLVHPALHEPFGRSVAEAMAAAKPVIAAADAGPREIIWHGENGITIERMTPEALAEAMQALAENPNERRRMGQAGREFVTSHLEPRRIAKQVYEFWCQTMAT